MKIDGLADSMNDNSTPHSASDYDREILRTVPFYHFFHTETIDLVRKLLPGVSVWLDTGDRKEHEVLRIADDDLHGVQRLS
jgi:hypothetical protein